MNEPKYDEDVVNLGYLKKAIAGSEENINKKYENVSKNYGYKPNTPYYKGDTWIDENNNVYTCINTREVGSYNDADWVSESGAKEEAESKNKIFLSKPFNYDAGDMWILQSDSDHKAGKKGEILITTAGREEYNEDDWVNMLSYGSIASINEVANNLNEAINRIGIVEETIEDGIITTYYQDTIPDGNCIGDLWYVTNSVDNYTKGKIYRYDGTSWLILDDPEITEAFEKANEAKIVADGKIQSFYSATEPTQDMGLGDLWIDISDKNKLYRYNGTNWVAVYDTRIDEVIKDIETTTERLVEISTDFGKITQTVSETTTKVEVLEDSIKYFSTDLDVYNITIPTDINQTPFETEEFLIGFYSYFKGKQVEPEVSSNSLNDGITAEILEEKIKLSVDTNTAISNLNNEFEFTFNYTEDDVTYSLIKRIVVTLALQGEKGYQGLQGEIGPEGPQGIQGEPGVDGISTYFYVKFSENSDGNPMTDNPTSSTQYMGVASTTSSSAPTSYSAYTWTKIKGEDGQNGSAGQAGENGQTSYLHIKYSADGENFTPEEEGYALGEKPSAYIGQYVDFNEEDSSNFEDYSWYKFTEDIDPVLETIQTDVNSINENTENMSNDISNLSNETKKLLEDFTSALDEYKLTVSTKFEQTEVDYTFLFNTLLESINSNAEGSSEQFAEISKYIRFEDGNIILGRSDNELILKIQNDRISYQQNGSEVAYFSNNQLYVTKIEVTESLKLGNFAFIPRANGNLSFRKVGG